MTDQEIGRLSIENVEWFKRAKDCLYEEFLKRDGEIQKLYEQNKTHRHFKTKKEAQEAMRGDFNPYNTFSYGRKKYDPPA